MLYIMDYRENGLLHNMYILIENGLLYKMYILIVLVEEEGGVTNGVRHLVLGSKKAKFFVLIVSTSQIGVEICQMQSFEEQRGLFKSYCFHMKSYFCLAIDGEKNR